MEQNSVTIDKIQTIICSCKEEIAPEYLYDFIQHTLKEHQVKITKNIQVFYSYMHHTKEYQISYYEGTNNILLPFEQLDNHTNKLYIYTDFFAVIENGQLYYFQVLNKKYNVEEIQEYVKRRLAMQSLEMCVLKRLEEKRFYTVNYLKKATYNYIGGYFLYLSVLCGIVFGTVMYHSEQSLLQKLSLNKEEKRYQQLQKAIAFKPQIYQHLEKFLHTLKQLNLNLLRLQYQHHQYTISISSQRKKVLYEFLKLYHEVIQQSNIEYNQKDKVYVLHTIFISA